MNAVKHGGRSRRAFFPIGESEAWEASLPPLIAMRIRNLMLAEDVGRMKLEGRHDSDKPSDKRERWLIDGMMWQLVRRIIRLERQAEALNLARAKLELSEAKRDKARALAELAAVRARIKK